MNNKNHTENTSNTQDFVTNYYKNKNQGTSASISAGYAAITRAYVDNTLDNPDKINFVRELNYIKVKNGHICDVNLDDVKKVDFNEEWKKINVGIHQDVDVLFGIRIEDQIVKLKNPQQVNQIFCGVFNLTNLNHNIQKYEKDNHYPLTKMFAKANYYNTFAAANSIRSS